MAIDGQSVFSLADRFFMNDKLQAPTPKHLLIFNSNRMLFSYYTTLSQFFGINQIST